MRGYHGAWPNKTDMIQERSGMLLYFKSGV